MHSLGIGALAKAAGVKVVTIRYYERVGLLPAPPRSRGNYRIYGAQDVARLQFVRRCRDLGFSLEQVGSLLRLSSQQHRACGEVDRITAEHLGEIERKVADLRRLADELRRLNKSCRGDGTIADCQILEALSPDRGTAPGARAKKFA